MHIEGIHRSGGSHVHLGSNNAILLQIYRQMISIELLFLQDSEVLHLALSPFIKSLNIFHT